MPPRGSKESIEKKRRGKVTPIDLDKLPPIYKCTMCGKTTQDADGKFFRLQHNANYAGNDGYCNLCSYCCDDLFAKAKEKEKDELTALMKVCAETGLYFSQKIYNQIQDKLLPNTEMRLGDYVRRLNLAQTKGKTFWDYVLNSVTTEKFLESKKEQDALLEENWTDIEKENMKTCIEIVGYDPFASYKESDRKFLFSELVKYIDDDLMDDVYKLSQIIQIVNNNNQIRIYDLLISQLNPLNDTKDISDLNALKVQLTNSNDKIAKENEISVKNRSNKDVGKSTLTYLMKDLREKNFDKAEADYYSQLQSAGTRWAADISIEAMRKNTYLDENDWKEIGDIRRELVDKLQKENDDLREEKRQLLIRLGELNG